MAYIAPDSDIILLRGVNIDSTHNHTILFEDASAQYSAFYGMSDKLVFNDQSYQRMERGWLRLGIVFDTVYPYNYMMFRNTAYGNKWFYAFIDGYEYINNNCTEIHYTIDPIQTWLFDYEMPACLVEREHSASDAIGDNLVAEDIDTGELEVQNYTEYNFTYFLGGILTSRPISKDQYVGSASDQIHYQIKTQFGPDGGHWWSSLPYDGGAGGIPSQLYLSYGYPVSDADINRYWLMNNNYLRYPDMQEFRPLPVGSAGTLYNTLGRMLEFINAGQIDAADNALGNLSMNDVIDVFIYPAEINEFDNVAAGTALGYKSPTGACNFQPIMRPMSFKENGDSTGYTPTNNKLFTYPYVQLLVSNNQGNTLNLKFEELNGYSSERFSPYFRWIGNLVGEPSVTLITNYNGANNNLQYALSCGNFPTPAYKGNTFTEWLQTNSWSWLFGTLGTAVSLGSGIGAMSPTQSMIPVMSKIKTDSDRVNNETGAYSSTSTFSHQKGERLKYNEGKKFPLTYATSLLGTLGTPLDRSNAPATVHATVTNDVLNIITNRTGFTFYALGVKKQFAKRIDDYFTMYGYATKELKVPNIYGSKRRRNFNYIKTAGAIIKPKAGTGLNAQAVAQLEDIYDNGITFWSSNANIGDYSLQNDIITV